MAIGANSYGTLSGVGVMCPMFSGDAYDFAATTRPASATVENWINQVSSVLNSQLATEGFSIPVTNADVKLTLVNFVEAEVVSIVEGINGSGRFGPTTKGKAAVSRFHLIGADTKEFIELNAVGFERLGATRTKHLASGIGYRDTDVGGTETFPLIQRSGFGDSFIDWDA